MKKNLINKKNIIYSSLQLILITATLFSGYLIDPIRKFYSNIFLIFPFIFALFALASILISYFLWKETKSYTKLVSYITICNICISAVILTIVLRIITTTNVDSFMAKTGFVSVIMDFCFVLFIVLGSLIPYFNSFRKRNFIKKDL